MNREKQHVILVHGARPCPCFMSMPQLYVNVHATWTWTCSRDMTCSMDRTCSREMTCSMEIVCRTYWYMQYGHGHATWTWTCSMYLSMLHVHVHTACLSQCSMHVSMLLYMSKSMLHVHVRATSTCSTDINMQPRHGHTVSVDMDCSKDMACVTCIRHVWIHIRFISFANICLISYSFCFYSLPIIFDLHSKFSNSLQANVSISNPSICYFTLKYLLYSLWSEYERTPNLQLAATQPQMMSRYIGDPDVIDHHCSLVWGGLHPKLSLGPRADNVIIPLDLPQLFCPSFTLTAGVSLVQWSTHLLPITRDPGSNPLGGYLS
jgi:hypothetical protein